MLNHWKLRVSIILILGLIVVFNNSYTDHKTEWRTPELSLVGQSFWKNVEPYFGAYKLALVLHHMGDVNGRRIPLMNYDYQSIEKWLEGIEYLNPQSVIPPYLAAFYFSSSKNFDHKRLICEYIENYVQRDWVKRWRWLPYAISILRHDLKDPQSALGVARSFIEHPNTPHWTKEIVLSLLLSLDKADAAEVYMRQLLLEEKELRVEEKAYLEHSLLTLQ